MFNSHVKEWGGFIAGTRVVDSLIRLFGSSTLIDVQMVLYWLWRLGRHRIVRIILVLSGDLLRASFSPTSTS